MPFDVSDDGEEHHKTPILLRHDGKGELVNTRQNFRSGATKKARGCRRASLIRASPPNRL
jgi:hypothetical protein